MVCIRVKCATATGPGPGPGVIRAGIRRCPRDHPLSHLPLSTISLFSLSAALCLQRRRHLGLRLGASSRVTFARAPTREIFATRADYRHLPGTVFPSSGNVSDEALKIGSNVLDEAFSVRAIPAPLIWSSFYLQSRAVSVHFRCIYAHMHRIHRSTRHSDRTRSLYRINYNVHRSRTCIAIRSMRVSYPGSFGSIISRKEKHNGRGTRTKNGAERSRVCRTVQDFETRSLDAGYLR